jgi:transcriptional regulator of acetoin/glycerol metabolism
MHSNEPDSTTLTERLRQLERAILKDALIATNCNIEHTAKRLNIPRADVYRRLRRLGWISRGPFDRIALYQHLVAMGESAEG